MPTPLERYFRNLNPVVFPGGATQNQKSRIELLNAWTAFERQVFTVAPRQLDRVRFYSSYMRKAAG